MFSKICTSNQATVDQMHVFTDDYDLANKIISTSPDWRRIMPDQTGHDPKDLLIQRLLHSGNISYSEVPSAEDYPLMVISKFAPHSQFEIIHSMITEGLDLPGGIICLAGYGERFKGFHDRAWEALPGNLHLSVLFKPGMKIERFETGLLALGPISVIEAISRMNHLPVTCGIKWVNDIVIDNAKVGGVLVRSQMTGQSVDYIILGIGINIAQSPQLPADPFVPATCHLRQYGNCSVRELLWQLLDTLTGNYCLFQTGLSEVLIKKYIDLSIIVGREIAVFSDFPADKPRELQRGRVTKIGEHLEIYLDNSPEPVHRGRVAFINDLF